jgi:ADP-heptose:LPS heptosyltransferase
LGDVTCTLPAAVALKKAFSDCHITWIVDERFATVVQCCKAVDEVRVSRIGFSPSTWPRFTEPFDVAFDLQGLMKSAGPVGLAKAKRKLAYHWQREASWLFAQGVKSDPSSWHIVDQYVDVVREAGATMDRAEFWLAPKSEDIASVKQKLDGLQEFVIFNAGAGWPTKRWTEEKFASLADRIGVPVVLIGGKTEDDKQIAARIAAQSSARGVSLVGETNVGELIALLSLCKAHVGGDTGSTHIAAALGRPCVGLYSITRPRRSCPYGQIDNCVYNPESLHAISVDEVLEKYKGAVA